MEKMSLFIEAALLFCIVASCLKVTESWDPLPPPTLSFHPSVNTSNIELFSSVELCCSIPDEATYPLLVVIAHAEVPYEVEEMKYAFMKPRQTNKIYFTLTVSPKTEGRYVCWYSKGLLKSSEHSNSVHVFISSVSKPPMALYISSILPVGGNYIVQCKTPHHELTNVKLSLYELPFSNITVKFLGSRALAPGEWSVSVTLTNVTKSVIFVCKMDVFYKQKVLQSTSYLVADIPDPLPPPTLSFHPSVNTSNIELFSSVELCCSIPDEATYPLSVILTYAEVPYKVVRKKYVLMKPRQTNKVNFTHTVSPKTEGLLMCWYSQGLQKSSEHSNSVNVFINSSIISKPIIALYPSSIFPVGGNYTVQCTTPHRELTNVTLSLYELPFSNSSETKMGSRALAPWEWRVSFTQTNVTKSVKVFCKMDVFYKQRVLQSTSDLVAAIPDELVTRLYSDSEDSVNCSGYLSLRVKGLWGPMCLPKNYFSEEAVADLACREQNCGHALIWNKLVNPISNATGTPKCAGNEKKIAECLILDPQNCEQQTLNIICSDAMPAPQLSAKGHGTASQVYIKTGESVELVCTFKSLLLKKNDWYLTITYNGESIRSGYGMSLEYVLRPTVDQGEYVCFARPDTSSLKRTENSNIVHIYNYDPPTFATITFAAIAAILGAAILICVCVCCTSQEDQQNYELSQVVPAEDPRVTHPDNYTAL